MNTMDSILKIFLMHFLYLFIIIHIILKKQFIHIHSLDQNIFIKIELEMI